MTDRLCPSCKSPRILFGVSHSICADCLTAVANRKEDFAAEWDRQHPPVYGLSPQELRKRFS